MASLDYAQSGVDRAAADRLVEKIAVLSKATLNRRVKASVGGYASLFELDKKRWLAASTDGVGTKLKLAFRLRNHRTVGIDLVAMSVNDILCVGAEPLLPGLFCHRKARQRRGRGRARRNRRGLPPSALRACGR